jgi:hypothetical protein
MRVVRQHPERTLFFTFPVWLWSLLDSWAYEDSTEVRLRRCCGLSIAISVF